MAAAIGFPSTFDNSRDRIALALVGCQGEGDEWDLAAVIEWRCEQLRPSGVHWSAVRQNHEKPGCVPSAMKHWGRTAARLTGIAALFLDAALRDHVNLADATPLRSIRASRVPTLLICGTADDNIPMRHSLELFRAGASHSELWIVEGAEHTGASDVNPQEFERRAVGWFEAHNRPL